MAEQMSVGLIGYGMAGRTFHAPVIQSVPNLRLKKVVERHSNERVSDTRGSRSSLTLRLSCKMKKLV